jgi:hypothetical protein
VILPILASQEARITDVSHKQPALKLFIFFQVNFLNKKQGKRINKHHSQYDIGVRARATTRAIAGQDTPHNTTQRPGMGLKQSQRSQG